MTILLPSLAVLIPILTLPFWFFYFDITPKIAALLTAAAAACALTPWKSHSLRALWRNPTARPLLLLFALQAAALLFATAVSTNPALSLTGSNWRYYGLFTQLALLIFTFFLTVAIASGELQLTSTFRAIAASGSLIALYAILQYLGWDPLLPAATYHIGEGEWTIVRPPGTIGHADYLGSYLVFVVFLGGSLLQQEKTAHWRLLGVASALLSVFAIILSGTRSAMLGIAVGIALVLFSFRPSWKQTTGVLLLCAASFTAFYYSPYGLKMRGRARWFREDPAGGARLLLWRDSTQMALQRWSAGWGPETFSTEFPHFQSLELARAYPDFYHESPHNIFLDELVAKGLPGALPFLLWSLAAGYAAWCALRRPSQAFLGIAMLAALVSLQFNAFVLTTAFFFYLTSAALLALPLRQSVPSASRPDWWLALPAFPLAALFLFSAIGLSIGDVLLAQVRTRLEAGDVVVASNKYATLRRWQAREGASDLYYSRNIAPLARRQNQLLLSVKAWQEAVQAGIRATRFAEDRHNAFYHLASLYAQVNNHQDAERSLRSAIAAAPNWFKPHWMLAQVLRATGRNEEALREAAAAVERDAGKHPEVSATLHQLRNTTASPPTPSAPR